LRKILHVPEECEINLVMAFGYPNENPVQEDASDSIKYWKDDKGVLHVPKRKMSDILHHDTYEVSN
jgi:hypothetical protein